MYEHYKGISTKQWKCFFCVVVVFLLDRINTALLFSWSLTTRRRNQWKRRMKRKIHHWNVMLKRCFVSQNRIIILPFSYKLTRWMYNFSIPTKFVEYSENRMCVLAFFSIKIKYIYISTSERLETRFTSELGHFLCRRLNVRFGRWKFRENASIFPISIT